MSNHSIIEHRANYHYLKVEEDLLAICSTGKQSPHCKALILSVLESWTNTKREKGESDYVYLTIPELIKYTYLLYGRNFIISCLDELLSEGLIERRPIKRHDQNTFEYKLVTETINARIRTLPEKAPKDIMPNLVACLASIERNKAIRAEEREAKREKEEKEKDSSLKINGGSLKINGVQKSTTVPFKNKPNLTTSNLTSESTNGTTAPASIPASSQKKSAPPTTVGGKEKKGTQVKAADPSQQPLPPTNTLNEIEQAFWLLWCSVWFNADIPPKLTDTAKAHIPKLAPFIKTVEDLDSLIIYARKQLEESSGVKRKQVQLGNLVNSYNGWKQTQPLLFPGVELTSPPMRQTGNKLGAPANWSVNKTAVGAK